MKNKSILLLAGLLFALPFSSRAADTAPEHPTLAAQSVAIETAILRGDDATLSTTVARCDARLAVNPKDAEALYLKAWVLLNQSNKFGKPEEKDRKRSILESAEKALAKRLELGEDAEALALHAAVLERSISVKGGMSMMTLGSKAGREYEQAIDLAPQNPRVALLRAVSTMHKPAFVGGSVEKALKEFRRAADLFEAAAKVEGGAVGLTWGRAETWAWIGQAEAKLGHKEAAKEAYAKALDIEPEYGWVRHVLLPQVQ